MNEPMSTADWLAKVGNVGLAHVSVSGGNPSVDEVAIELSRTAEAWVCLPSSVLRCVQGKWYDVTEQEALVSAPGAAECAFALSAEIQESETSSIHVWRDGGRLRWTRISEGVGEEALALEDVFVSTEPDLKLNYKTFWTRGPDQDNGVRPWSLYVSRFTGWGAL